MTDFDLLYGMVKSKSYLGPVKKGNMVFDVLHGENPGVSVTSLDDFSKIIIRPEDGSVVKDCLDMYKTLTLVDNVNKTVSTDSEWNSYEGSVDN
jgi:hypothetical protein